MKVKEDGPSPGLPLTPRELLCLESDSRWERGVAYLALFPPPSSAESFVPPPLSLLYGATKRTFLILLRFITPISPSQRPRLKR